MAAYVFDGLPFEGSGESSHSAEGAGLSGKKRGIATLSIRAISSMSRDELIAVICAADLPLVDARKRRHLPFMDRPSLERLAHLARRCCRTRAASEDEPTLSAAER